MRGAMLNMARDVDWALDVAKRLYDIRIKNGFTQEQLAEVMEVSLSTYKKIEGAQSHITVERLLLLKEKLGISSDLLLYGESKNLEDTQNDIMNLNDTDKLNLFLRMYKYFYRCSHLKYSSSLDNDDLDDNVIQVIKLLTADEEL